MVGFTSTVLEGAQLTLTDAEYLRCSMTAANTLLSIIDQLLDYSKWARQAEGGSASKQPLGALAVAPLRVSTILDELVDVVGGRAASKGVSLRVEATAGVQAARLCGDAPRLRQVLLNLTENALKFVRAGGTVAFHSFTAAPYAGGQDHTKLDARNGVEKDPAGARLWGRTLKTLFSVPPLTSVLSPTK